MQEKIKVLIAEDMEPIRKRYVHILSQNEEISVVADVGTGQEACEAARQYQPDVILMDIEMETKDAGIRAAGQILSMYPETPHRDPDRVRRRRTGLLRFPAWGL